MAAAGSPPAKQEPEKLLGHTRQRAVSHGLADALREKPALMLTILVWSEKQRQQSYL